MNERIEELIVAYLHRGSTPEQERELFEACRDDADVAQLLRRHLTLSLKIRRLRDETEVPPELHARLVGRINEIEHEQRTIGIAPLIPRITGKMQRLAFGWRHLAGTAIAGAALATMVFLLLPGRTIIPETTARIVTVTDTLRETRVDTLVTTRTVFRASLRTAAPVASNDAQATQDVGVPSDLQDDAPIRSDDFADTAPARPLRTGSDSRRGTSGDASEASIPSYIEQYTMMVSSLDQIVLTSQDRVR